LLDGLKYSVLIKGIVFTGQSSRKWGVSVGAGFLSVFPTSLMAKDAQVLAEELKKKNSISAVVGF